MLELYELGGLVCLVSDTLAEPPLRPGVPDPLPGRLRALAATGLAAWWASARRYPAAAEWRSLDLPRTRPLTRLTTPRLGLLAQECRERDLNDDGRALDVLLAEPGAPEPDVAARAAFADGQGPLRLALHRVADEELVRIFLPRAPDPRVTALLAAWGCAPHAAVRRPAARLRGLDYERLFGGPD